MRLLPQNISYLWSFGSLSLMAFAAWYWHLVGLSWSCTNLMSAVPLIGALAASVWRPEAAPFPRF